MKISSSSLFIIPKPWSWEIPLTLALCILKGRQWWVVPSYYLDHRALAKTIFEPILSPFHVAASTSMSLSSSLLYPWPLRQPKPQLQPLWQPRPKFSSTSFPSKPSDLLPPVLISTVPTTTSDPLLPSQPSDPSPPISTSAVSTTASTPFKPSSPLPPFSPSAPSTLIKSSSPSNHARLSQPVTLSFAITLSNPSAPSQPVALSFPSALFSLSAPSQPATLSLPSFPSNP